MCHCARTLVCFSLPPLRFSGLYESRALLSGKPKQRACIHYLIRSLKGLIGLRVLWFLFHFAMLMEEEPII